MEIQNIALLGSDSMVGVIFGKREDFFRNFNKSRTTLCMTPVQNTTGLEPHKCDGWVRAAV